MELALLAAVIGLAAVFCFINGFHDASNSVATAVRTRALTPSIAVILAATFTSIGTLFGGALAVLVVTADWIIFPEGNSRLGILLAALAGAALWGLYTWWIRMPSSSTHALIGGVLGAGAAASIMGGDGITNTDHLFWTSILLPLLLSPLIAFALSYLLVIPLSWYGRHKSPQRLNRHNRMGQSIAAGMFALGHGMQDGQRTMTVVMLALVGSGMASGRTIPLWVQLFAVFFLAAGTLFGGWRITHTLGYKLVPIDPMRGMIAQGVGSVMLFLGAIAFHLPLSSTHTVTSAIVGAGTNQRFESVRWQRAGRILVVWLLTPAVTFLAGAIFYLALNPLL